VEVRGGVDMNRVKACILFSTADWDSPYWTNKQHTAKQFAQSGVLVLYVESIGLRRPNLGSVIDLRRIIRRLARWFDGVHCVEKNIYVLSPLVFPFLHRYDAIKWINGVLVKAAITSFMKNQYLEDSETIIWTYHPYSKRLMPRGNYLSVIYHCVDNLGSIPNIDGDDFNKEERQFLEKAHIVFVTSLELFRHCSAYNQNTHYYSNVVDFDHFSKAHNSNEIPYDIVKIPRPIIGYVGSLSDLKVDFSLLFEVALKSENCELVLIGLEREGQSDPYLKKLKTLKNVHLLGYKKYKELPSYLKYFDVGLLPALRNDYTKSMFPMKYYEYIAAGVPVVSTPLDFTRERSDFVELGSNSKDFILGITKQLKRGKLSMKESQQAVGENTWEKRFHKMLELIPKK
jgi:glycosyltransferase involved in cell wall biosynthesis